MLAIVYTYLFSAYEITTVDRCECLTREFLCCQPGLLTTQVIERHIFLTLDDT